MLKAVHQRMRRRCEQFASSEPLRDNCNGGKQKVRSTEEEGMMNGSVKNRGREEERDVQAKKRKRERQKAE